MSLFARFADIDQQAVWLSPYRQIHRALTQDLQDGLSLAVWLNDYFAKQNLTLLSGTGEPVSFTDQSDLPHGVAYEAYIAQHHKIPTRDNLHDWFGACIWSVFPKAKAMLNAHHLKHLHDNQAGNGRNRIRDAITVFDENGVIVATSLPQIKTALYGFDWQNALVSPREHWHNPNAVKPCQIQATIFGHALLEQLITPRKNLCGHAMVVVVDDGFFALDESAKLAILDEKVAQLLDEWLSQADSTPRDLQPLPILGVPYFWQNQDADFYADTQVFRAGRQQKS